MDADALDTAGSVLGLVKAEVGAAEAEVIVDRTELALTRFANSYIHQNVTDERTTVRLRLHHNGRTATGSTTISDQEGLRDLVRRTVAAARLCPPDPHWPGLTPPTPLSPMATVDRATAPADPDQRADCVRAFVAAADGLPTAGFCSTRCRSVAFANSTGHSAYAETAQAAMDGIARMATSDGMARLAAPRLADLDGARLGRRAAAKARAGTDPVELPPGRYEVVLEPTAVVDLLDFMARHGFNGKAIAEHLSFVEVGADQFDPAVTLVDDAFDPGVSCLPFDVEGTPRQRMTFVDKGVTVAVAHDRRSAAAGTGSTGHAALGSASSGAIADSLHLLPHPPSGGTAAPSVAPESDGPPADAAVADLVGQVGYGLLVTDNWYTRVLDPRTLVVTGLTRNGVWLIEDGQITRPVQNLRFTQSYPRALAPGAVLAVGSHSIVPPSRTGSCHRVPALRLASWNYTGSASG